MSTLTITGGENDNFITRDTTIVNSYLYNYCFDKMNYIFFTTFDEATENALCQLVQEGIDNNIIKEKVNLWSVDWKYIIEVNTKNSELDY